MYGRMLEYSGIEQRKYVEVYEVSAYELSLR